MSETFKSYRVPWAGPTMLACKKCQKKLKYDKLLKPLSKLRKTVKQKQKRVGRPPVHVVDVACMDLCPKNGVAVCKPADGGDRLYILRSPDDLDRLSLVTGTAGKAEE